MSDVPNVLPGVLETAREHARSGAGRPVGGILIGWLEGDAMTVERAVPTPAAEEHAGELVFTPACWDQAYAELESANSESRIVGWFHSSSTHGADLSAYDRTLHRTLFPDPAHVALAVDPRSEDVAWFGWQVERIAQLPAEIEDSTPTEEESQAERAWTFGSARPRRRLAGSLIALLLLGAVAAGGFVWGHSTSRTRTVTVTETAPATPPTSSAPSGSGSSQLELEQARAEVQALKADLADQAARLTAAQTALEKAKSELREAKKKPKPPATFVLRYRVRSGDTMFTLAETFYGTGDAWAKIWHANPSPNPDIIRTGSVLRIPLENPD